MMRLGVLGYGNAPVQYRKTFFIFARHFVTRKEVLQIKNNLASVKNRSYD